MKCKNCEEVLSALDEFLNGLYAELNGMVETVELADSALREYVDKLHDEEVAKVCYQCGARETPQWRTYDDRLFCNACGIRYYRTVK